MSFASVKNFKHTELLTVGSHTIRFSFSDYPIQAQRSLDIVYAPTSGKITNLKGHYRLIRPNGSVDSELNFLPRYPRDNQFWGLDSIALKEEGLWKFEITLNGITRALPLEVGPPPNGPPASLIMMIAMIPLVTLFGLVTASWRRTQPVSIPLSQTW
ncbi:hypothetical protein ACFFLM_08110 [Deinococcus oregonensis]|uniref:P/Homo B domain-containing protein n=1 Tax=Deinococcus oregonensis TaxID=1805970 RepID=A0ABV6B0D0_9DEIO